MATLSSKVYAYSFDNNYQGFVFGNYQSGFNFSLTLDETKDSCKIIVYSNNDTILKPNTIIRLENIDAWWCVKKDTRQARMNESGYFYEHTLELQGAFEILNSRDLISCGFNTDHYTIEQVLTRLFSLSDLGFEINIDYNNVIYKDKVVDYIKTFENYTLASAIKEFLSGYNCIPKLEFQTTGYNSIIRAILKIYSKSGLVDTPLNESVFNDINQVDTIDRESYGTKVISNIQNCVGRKSVAYPRIGASYLVGDNGQIVYDSASQSKLLLPSKVYSVESIELYPSVVITCSAILGHNILITPDDLSRNLSDLKRKLLNDLPNETKYPYTLNNYWEEFVIWLKYYCIGKVYNGGYYDAIENAEHGSYMTIHNNLHPSNPVRLYLNNERYAYNGDGQYHWIISWKQGSNEIKGIGEAIAHAQKESGTYPYSVLEGFDTKTFNFIYAQETLFTINIDERRTFVNLIDSGLPNNIGIGNDPVSPHCLFKVNYTPMNDIKFKTDNNIDGNENKLYNQNGKLVDSYAVSKLVNSYCKSIRERELTRFGTYYKFADIPKLGARVGNYVINNISYDVYDNDDKGFMYQCQFSLNLYSICKSTMINAHTNIRDYDCPQSNNIRRTQTYRDYVELSYTKVVSDTPYLNKAKLFNLSLNSIGLNDDLVFVMKATDSSFVNQGENNSHNYYYHLDHISFALSKQYKIIVDFGDNNIIGYGNAHAYKPFALSNIINMDKSVTIPISYVDNYGELDGIELIASDYETAENNFDGIYISESVAIKSSIYANFESNNLLVINESNYKKDGLEVPVFEYSCEINGDSNIEVADDFFEYEEGFDNFIAVKSDYPITNENQGIVIQGSKNVCAISYSNDTLTLSIYSPLPQSAKGHWGIYALKGTKYRFLFALNNYANDYVNDNEIVVYTNYYKLK